MKNLVALPTTRRLNLPPTLPIQGTHFLLSIERWAALVNRGDISREVAMGELPSSYLPAFFEALKAGVTE